MSDSGNSSELSPLLGRVGNLALAIQRQLGKLPPVGQLIVFLIATGLAFYGFYRWNSKRQSALNASFAALSGKVEATAQAYKGIEALVLAGTETNPTEQSALTDKTAAIFGAIVTTLEKNSKPSFPLTKLTAIGLPNESYADQFLTLTEGETLRDSSAPGTSPPGEASYAYVFVPGIALKGLSPAEFSAHIRSGRAPNDNEDILASLAVINAIWKPLTEFTGQQLFKDRPATIVQSFFLLRTGALVIHQSGVPESQQRKHYLSQFIGHTFLPDRPYFWNAINTRRDRIQQAKSRYDSTPDYQTAPYVDLGTNGPIQTYCWGFVGKDNPNAPESVLCLDIKLSGAENAVVTNLKEIGAQIKKVNCDLDTNSCLYVENNQIDTDLSVAAQNAQRSGNGQLEVFGGIHVMLPHSKSVGPVQFHIPVQTFMKDGRRTLSILECTLDLGGLQFENDSLLILALCPCLLAIGALVNLASVYAARTKQLKSAVQNIHFLMSNASEPYVLVDPENRIVNANCAFAEMVGSATIAGIRSQDIRDFMKPASSEIYNRERKKRIDEESSEYELTFVRNDKGERIETTCMVYGAPLPVPHEFRRSMPHSVALLKKLPEKAGAARQNQEVVRSAMDSNGASRLA